jgi:hypothetical protein
LKIRAQILPSWIERFDQRNLSCPQLFFVPGCKYSPDPFDLLFSGNGQTDIAEGLEIDQFGHIVASGEAGTFFCLCSETRRRRSPVTPI